MAWLWKKSRGHAEAIKYHDGVAVEVGEQEFVVSIRRIAVLLWMRFYRRSIRTGPKERFIMLYEAVRQAVLRLEETNVDGVPLLRRLGHARTDMPGKASDLFGQRWTMAGSVVDRALDELAPCGAPEVLFSEEVERLYGVIVRWSEEIEPADSLACIAYRSLYDNYYVQKSSSGELVADVARVYDIVTTRDFRIHDRIVEGAARTGGLNRYERSVLAFDWQRRHARGNSWGGAHITVGAWQHGQATARDRRDLACTVPFLVADIDGPALQGSLGVVLQLLHRLVSLGVNPHDLAVAYPGGQGLHVRIPHGLVGRPLWPRAADVAPVLGRFFERLCDGLSGPHGPLVKSLDSALFSPLHSIRAVGSEFEKVMNRRCVAYRGDDFLALWGEFGDGILDILEGHSASLHPGPFSLPHPERPHSVPALEALLRCVIEDGRQRPELHLQAGTRTEPLGIIEAIRRGVRPGEEFAPGYVGRNYAALLLSNYLLTHGGLSKTAAWNALERWNAANPVPLGEAEGDTQGELERVFDRACRYVSQSGSAAQGLPPTLAP